MPRFLILTAVAGLLALPAAAATITLTLDEVPEVECDADFTDGECTLRFTTTTGEDLTPGFCLFVEDANNFGQQGVYLWPARLVLDLSNVEGIESVEVDVYETHFAGSTRAFLYGEDGTIDSMVSFTEDDQTLGLDAGGAVPTTFAVSAHEAYVWEIRLIGAGVAPTSSRSFSAVKALYR
jgi:hypothetical protein